MELIEVFLAHTSKSVVIRVHFGFQFHPVGSLSLNVPVMFAGINAANKSSINFFGIF